MEDKEMMKIINEKHETAYKGFVKSQKRKQIIETLKIALLTILVIAGFILAINTLRKDTLKAIDYCMAKGHEYNYCLKDAQ